jgi:O-6-methylguanine DNA methyltransferase
LRNNGFTPFQIRVYKEVSSIPWGRTRSYKWVAQRIGSPGSSRAVGAALRKNPFFFIIPCHRVIRKDGEIGGFSGGRRLKKRLLELEKIAIIKGH